MTTLRLRFEVDGQENRVPLTGGEIRFGRSGDNEVVLPDYSVSRRHAALRPEGELWFIHDLGSTNGVQVNRTPVQRSLVRAGDAIKIGVFELEVETAAGDVALDNKAPTVVERLSRIGGESGAAKPPALGAPAPPVPPPLPDEVGRDSAISNATIVRPLADFTAEFRLDALEEKASRESSEIRQIKREALDQAYSSKVFGFLTRLARLLITTDSDDEVLEYVLEIAFEALPVDRGFILLRDAQTGELECELMRVNDKVERSPKGPVPISKTMLESVIRERVALLTYDAQSDRRLAGTESVRIHQIRAAMCAPLWSGEKIIGVMQVDTPHHTGSFTEPDVDLLAALANYCAVAIERLRHARDAEFQRHVRSRLERYHSPAVIEEIMQGSPSGEEGLRRLKMAEVSVLFADVVGFTAFSENAPPEQVAELLEGYFSHAVEAIFSAGGTLDKYIGDCVMAFFGAPVELPDHALRAVQAAVRMRSALAAWNTEREARDLPRVAVRIGINSGPVVVGDIGSKRRVDYTVLGNTVNVAARLEELVAKPGDIVLGDATCRQLAGQVATESLGELDLKGLSRKTVAHRVVPA